MIAIDVTFAQTSSSHVSVITVYSQNEQFFLRSIPYDNISPSLRGKTFVYKKSSRKPLYTIDVGFDVGEPNGLILSNDGEIVFHIITSYADEAASGLKSVNIYKTGRLLKSYTQKEITGCDEKKERCSLLYSNYDEVVDHEKSKAGTAEYRKILKEGVDEGERFLSDFPIFSFDDTVYLTDSRKKVHLFDLVSGDHFQTHSFESIFNLVRSKARTVKTESKTYESPLHGLPKLRNGKNAHELLARLVGMKAAANLTEVDERFRWYTLEVTGNLSRDGSFEIEKIDVDDELPKDKIIEFFRVNRFETGSIPEVFKKWHLDSEYFNFRKKDDRIAQNEREADNLAGQQEFERRLTLEEINDVYIPANLGECFTELDRLLTEIDKKEMKELPAKRDMILYHLGLGMWMRNKWGLWGGSRLQKYFSNKQIDHPDDMSSVILFLYHDWLNGRKETWKDWEKNPTKPFPEDINESPQSKDCTSMKPASRRASRWVQIEEWVRQART